MEKKNKHKVLNKDMIAGLILTVSCIIAIAFGTYNLGIYNNGNCQPVVCSNVVCNGAISADFILQKIGDHSETSAFCNTKGYDSGIGTGMRIFCQDEERYKNFNVMTDFVPYLYEKYKPEEVK